MDICSDLKEVKSRISKEESFALYFSDGICGVAESLYPKLEELFTLHFMKIGLQSVIGPMSPEIQGHFQVFSAPCLLVFIDGKEIMRKAGHFSVEYLHKDLDRLYSLRFL